MARWFFHLFSWNMGIGAIVIQETMYGHEKATYSFRIGGYAGVLSILAHIAGLTRSVELALSFGAIQIQAAASSKAEKRFSCLIRPAYT